MTKRRPETSADSATRILIVDDHPTVCEGLTFRLSRQPDMEVCGQAADVSSALKRVAELKPQIAIVDIGLKNSDGLELIKRIKSRYKQTRTLVHSMYDESVYASRCLQAGAMGYVNKEADPSEVIQAIRAVVAGRVHLSSAMTEQLLSRSFVESPASTDPLETLTNRQLEVFRLIASGKKSAEIAKALHISRHTFDTHRENIKQKLGVESAAELIRLAARWEAQAADS